MQYNLVYFINTKADDFMFLTQVPFSSIMSHLIFKEDAMGDGGSDGSYPGNSTFFDRLLLQLSFQS